MYPSSIEELNPSTQKISPVGKLSQIETPNESSDVHDNASETKERIPSAQSLFTDPHTTHTEEDMGRCMPNTLPNYSTSTG